MQVYVGDYYRWSKVSGLEAMRYWVDESQMENCSALDEHDDLSFRGHFSAIVRFVL